MRRGDDIPPVSDYAHWNEDAAAIWYAENRYDMEHADEEIDDDFDRERDYEEPEPDIDEMFDTKEEAQAFYDAHSATAHSITMRMYGGDRWYVEGFSKQLYQRWTDKRYRRRH